MAQSREKGGRVVFIGNIPYGVSEEQICEIFGRVGQVLNFRLVYDKETGRPKGFGFLEYADADAAASAVRNLNEFDVMGRTLRVDYSNDNGGGGQRSTNANPQQDLHTLGAVQGMTAASTHMPMNITGPPQPNGAQDPSALPPLPHGVDVPPGLTAPDAISKTLQALSAPQLLDILSQTKKMAVEDPQKAAALLASAPQLSYALFQALLLLGLVDPSVLGSLIQAAPQQQPPPAVQPPQPMYQQPQYQQPPPYGQPPPNQFGAPPPPSHNPYPQANYNPTPPIHQPAYQPPPPQQPPAGPPQATDPQQAAMIQQVMALTREQIFSMDEAARNQILTLRAQWGAPVS